MVTLDVCLRRLLNIFLANKFRPHPVNPDVEKTSQVKYITLPFQGHYNYQIINKLQRLLYEHIPLILDSFLQIILQLESYFLCIMIEFQIFCALILCIPFAVLTAKSGI